MQSDRELLELAAKAAGINAVIACAFGDSDVVEECKLGLWNRERGGVWNPLRDDGDALRLAVKLGISGDICLTVHFADTLDPAVVVRHGVTLAAPQWIEEVASDPYAATRRAIVRAAAALAAVSHEGEGRK